MNKIVLIIKKIRKFILICVITVNANTTWEIGCMIGIVQLIRFMVMDGFSPMLSSRASYILILQLMKH